MADFIERLNSDIEQLRNLLSQFTSDSVAGVVRYHIMSTINIEEEGTEGEKLMSPAKQLSFLLSLMLSTPEPLENKGFRKLDWQLSKQLLNKIFSAYQNLFWPTQEGMENLNDEWIHIREVAMPSFLHYHNTALLATIEQISGRIQKYCTPFDSELKQEVGISATDALQIAKFLQKELQGQASLLTDFASHEYSERQKILEEAEKEAKTINEFGKIVQEKITSSSYGEKALSLFKRIKKLGIVSFDSLKEEFPDSIDAYWRNFTIERGAGPFIEYPTESYVFDAKPLILTESTEANCPYPNKLFEAILITCESVLGRGKFKEAFLTHRDKTLEKETESLFKGILSEDSQIYTSAFETNDAHLEHDIVIVSGNKLLIVEAKASPPVEPFRDPEKAFTRIKRSFKSKSGIQNGFEQGARILRRLDNGETVSLYDRKGNLLTKLDPRILSIRLCACVTRDDFGYLATDLSLLLEKRVTDKYPWVINILALEFLKDAWAFLKWGTDELYNYLLERVKCHGKILGSDELEFLGAHIHHGSLKELVAPPNAKVQLNPRYSDFFDELYFHLNYGAPAPKVKVVKPVLMDIRKSLKNDEPSFVPQSLKVQQVVKQHKVGRNEPCFCGSGKKYKKCHG